MSKDSSKDCFGADKKCFGALVGMLAFGAVLWVSNSVVSASLSSANRGFLINPPIHANNSCERLIDGLSKRLRSAIFEGLAVAQTGSSVAMEAPMIHFVDLGANRGDSMEQFADRNSVIYTLMFSKFPAEKARFEAIWNNGHGLNEKAYLFEANPRLKKQLYEVKKRFADRINTTVNVPVAIWTEDVESIDFYLDTIASKKGLGSSLSAKHNSVTRGGRLTKVSVAAYGLCSYLWNVVQPQKHDIVLLKMDIEGAEFEIVYDMLKGEKRRQCWPLIDHFFIEIHNQRQLGEKPPDHDQFAKLISDNMFGRSYPWI